VGDHGRGCAAPQPREADVRRHTVVFEHLQATALDPANSVQVIEAQRDAFK
jgi:hypothetical protein